MDTLAKIFVCSMLCQIALGLEFINPGEPGRDFSLKANVGDEITLNCMTKYMGDEDVFSSPTKWHKTQEEEKKESPEMAEEISNLRAMSGVFDDTNRFEVTIIQGDGSSSFNLKVSNVQPEDSGYYFCYGKTDDTVHFIRYDVMVQVPHTDIRLTTPSENSNSSQDAALIFKKDVGSSVLCEASGGYPNATLKVYIEGEETPLRPGSTGYSVDRTGDNFGLQTLSAKSYVKIDGLLMRPDQSGKEIICEVVSQTNMIRASRVLSVLFGPSEVKCDSDVQARPGDENVSFGCKFAANPIPEQVVWTVRAGSEKILVNTDGQVVDDQYSASLRLIQETTSSGLSLFETRFNILRVEEDHFHGYEVEIKSAEFPPYEETFVLTMGERPVIRDNDGNGSASHTSISYMLLLFTLAALFIRSQHQ